MDQISSIEHFLDPGEVAISTEVAQQVQHCLVPTAPRHMLGVGSLYEGMHSLKSNDTCSPCAEISEPPIMRS